MEMPPDAATGEEPVWTTVPNMQHARVLCDAIRTWQVNGDQTEFSIDWKAVSAVVKEKGVVLSPTNCHVLWKYLAYGMVITKNTESPMEDNGVDCDDVDIESDEEDGFVDPRIASLAFQVDSFAPHQEKSRLLPSGLSWCYSSNHSLCAMVIAHSKPMASEKVKNNPLPQQEDSEKKKHLYKPKHALHVNKTKSIVCPVKSSAKVAAIKPSKIVSPNNVPCAYCKKLFTKTGLLRHIQLVHPVQAIMQDLLAKVSKTTENTLPKSISIAPPPKPPYKHHPKPLNSSGGLRCKYCSNTFLREDITSHMNCVHPVEAAKERAAVKPYSALTKRTHHSTEQAQPDSLKKNKTTAAPVAMLRHPLPSTKTVPESGAIFTCKVCQIKAPTKEGITSHMLAAHPKILVEELKKRMQAEESAEAGISKQIPQQQVVLIKDQSVECLYCHVTLKKASLKQHMKIKHPDKVDPPSAPALTPQRTTAPLPLNRPFPAADVKK